MNAHFKKYNATERFHELMHQAIAERSYFNANIILCKSNGKVFYAMQEHNKLQNESTYK